MASGSAAVELLQLQDLSLQRCDTDAPRFATLFADFDALLLLLHAKNSGLLVVLGFEPGVVFAKLIGCPSNHFKNFGSFGKLLFRQQTSDLFGGQFVGVGQKPAPPFDSDFIIQCRSRDLKVFQLQKVNLQIVGQGKGLGFFAESEIEVQLSGLIDECAGKHTDTVRRLQSRVIPALLLPKGL